MTSLFEIENHFQKVYERKSWASSLPPEIQKKIKHFLLPRIPLIDTEKINLWKFVKSVAKNPPKR